MDHSKITSIQVNGRELPVIDGCVTCTVVPEPQEEQVEEGNVTIKPQGWSVTWKVTDSSKILSSYFLDPNGPIPVQGTIEPHGISFTGRLWRVEAVPADLRAAVTYEALVDAYLSHRPIKDDWYIIDMQMGNDLPYSPVPDEIAFESNGIIARFVLRRA